MGDCYSEAKFISNIKIWKTANAPINDLTTMLLSCDRERAQWEFQWVYQQAGKCHQGGKKNQNSQFLRYILLPNTEYKITKRKKEKDLSVK